MTPSDALPTIAEIAITLTGFTGVVAVFRPGSAGSWSEEELQRIRAVLYICTLVPVCALIPFGLADLQSFEAVTWGVPLLLYATVM